MTTLIVQLPPRNTAIQAAQWQLGALPFALFDRRARMLRAAHASAQGADHYSVDCRARSAAAERSACAALQSAAARHAAECGGRSTGAGRAELPYCAGANAGAAIRIQTQASVHAPACHHRPGLVPVYTHGFY